MGSFFGFWPALIVLNDPKLTQTEGSSSVYKKFCAVQAEAELLVCHLKCMSE